MKITFVGTGSIIPNPKIKGKHLRSYSAVYVEIGKDTLLFDIGPGTLTKLQQMGIDTRIYPSHLFITHYHIDHCQDYISLVKGRCFNLKTGKVGKGRSLKVYGPPDLVSWSLDLFEKTKRWSYMKNALPAFDVLSLKETKSGLVEQTGSWKVSCLPVKHYDGVAFRLDAEGKSFVYSGDMVYDENLAILGKNADLVAIECSFPDRESLQGLHLCPEDIGKLAKLGNFKKVILTHMYPQCEGKEEEMIKNIESISSAKTKASHDFLQIEL